MIKKNTIIKITEQLYCEKKIKENEILFIDKKKDLDNIFEKSYSKDFLFAIINLKKIPISYFIKSFFLLRGSKIYKNFLIYFNFDKEIVAYNFFPDWPNRYKFNNKAKSMIYWLKKFFSIFLNYKKINFVAIRFK